MSRFFLLFALALPFTALADSVCKHLPPDCFSKAPLAAAKQIRLRLIESGPGLTNKRLSNPRIGVSCVSIGSVGSLEAHFSVDLSGILEFPGEPAERVTYHLVGKTELDPQTCERAIDHGEWHQVEDYRPGAK
jgi:hypothetical protein